LNKTTLLNLLTLFSSLTRILERGTLGASWPVLLLLALLSWGVSQAQNNSSELEALIVGEWVINEDLSDETDDQVAEALEGSGGRDTRGLFNRKKDFYRGGPPEQELYDRLSYDMILRIEYSEPEFRFHYADDYTRVFHTDGRRRRTTANDFYTEGGVDFSFGNWDGASLIVEARPRDGGFTLETYTLENGGNRLRVEMMLEPDSFSASIELIRVYDRSGN
jgi:hypothetical protein